MHGPFWRILVVGILSILIGVYVGELLVRKLAGKMFEKHLTILEYTIRSFAIVLIGSIAAFVASWEVGYLMGKITGAIENMSWTVVLVYTPLMSFIYSIPVSLGSAALFGLFVFFYLKSGNKYQGLHPRGWSPPP